MKMFKYLFLIIVFLWGFVGTPGFAEIQQHGIIVPNVQGIAYDIAEQILRTLGLEPIVQHETRDSSIVVSQEPKAGMLLPAGGEVIIATGVLSPQTITTTQAVRESYLSAEPVPETGMSDATQLVHTLELRQSSSTVSNTVALQARPPMAWYPRQFLTSEQPKPKAFQVQSQRSQRSNILSVIPLTAKEGMPILVTTSQGWQEGWLSFSRQSPQQPSSLKTTSGQSSIYSVQSGQAATSGAVPVPYVIRLPQADAIHAIQKAGLTIGTIIPVQDAHLKAGLVVSQSPRASSIVVAGTQVSLWVVE